VTVNYTLNDQNSCFPVNLFGEEEFVDRNHGPPTYYSLNIPIRISGLLHRGM
jgi:hypothetical protein